MLLLRESTLWSFEGVKIVVIERINIVVIEGVQLVVIERINIVVIRGS